MWWVQASARRQGKFSKQREEERREGKEKEEEEERTEEKEGRKGKKRKEKGRKGREGKIPSWLALVSREEEEASKQIIFVEFTAIFYRSRWRRSGGSRSRCLESS